MGHEEQVFNIILYEEKRKWIDINKINSNLHNILCLILMLCDVRLPMVLFQSTCMNLKKKNTYINTYNSPQFLVSLFVHEPSVKIIINYDPCK